MGKCVVEVLISPAFLTFYLHGFSTLSVMFSLCIISGLSYPVYKGVMRKGYKVPTPIQRKVSQCHFPSVHSTFVTSNTSNFDSEYSRLYL